jgi:hypothetical protein
VSGTREDFVQLVLNLESCDAPGLLGFSRNHRVGFPLSRKLQALPADARAEVPLQLSLAAP